MKHKFHIPGAVLPTVMVVSVLLLATVLAVAALWESDFLFFSRHRSNTARREHIESAFLLYREYPDRFVENTGEDSTFLLYDSVPHSRVTFSRRPWGLYEIVTIEGHGGGIHISKMFGVETPYSEDVLFWYRDNNAALTLTGESRFKGHVRIPRSGVVYGQMGSVFFAGEKLETAMMKESGTGLPAPETTRGEVIKQLSGYRDGEYEPLVDDSLRVSFNRNETLLCTAGGTLEGLYLSGNIILKGEKIEIHHSCRIQDIVVIGAEIRIGEGFRGNLQAFATDSLIVADDVSLLYPSGLYSSQYMKIGDRSEVNGYAITKPEKETSVREANYIQSRLATVRGLVYVSGTAQFQGIVSGAVFLDKAVYYSPRGYYENMIYDGTVLANRQTAYPLWLEAPSRRKEVKWLY